MDIGLHVSKGKNKTLYDALENSIKIFNINVIQIYVANTRTGKIINFKKDEKKKIKNMVKDRKIKLFAHASYNTIKIWNKKLVNEGIKLLIRQMSVALECGAKGVVLHLPKRTCEHIYDILNATTKEINSIDIKLLLEPPAFKSDAHCSYELPSKLNKLTKYINKTKIKNWGYTIDTAHLWSSIREKKYPIKTYEGAKVWLKDLSTKSKKKIILFHLNGSHSLTGKDIHAIPIFGTKKNTINKKRIPDYLWGEILNKDKSINKDKLKDSSLYCFVTYATIHNIPMLLEVNVTNSGDPNYSAKQQTIDSLNIIKKIISNN